MKILSFTFAIALALSITSCRVHHTCPTYMKANPVEKGTSVSVEKVSSEKNI